MLNAEDIISLEKKWFAYKFKSKIKFLLIITLIFCLILSGIFTYFYISKVSLTQSSQQVHKITSIKNAEVLHVKPSENNNTQKSETIHEPIIIPQKKEENTTKPPIVTPLDENRTNKSTVSKIEEKKEAIVKNRPSYYLKIQPTLKNNDLFSSSGRLHFNPPFIKTIKKEEVAQSIQTKSVEKKNEAISISSSEIDTITYLKDKFSSTNNVVFAIMLSEELYNMQKYDQSIQWALTANELDPTNEKSWYWFAKNKVQLHHKEDAIKALEIFLSNNRSSRLKTLLKEIKNGE